MNALAVFAVAWLVLHTVAITGAQSADVVPVFEVERGWPKPLPNKWTVGPVSGIATDGKDHIWIIQRGETVKEAGGVPAPPVIEFDAAGNVVQTWGGPGAGYDWPEQVHGITVDAKDRVWISGNGELDSHILAFTRAGKFLLQIGRPGARGGSNDTANVARATQMRLDPPSNELFVSDGEMNQNHRVIVFDAQSGAYKRHWGAYGARPDDSAATTAVEKTGSPPRQWRRPVRLHDSSATPCTAFASIATASCMCVIEATADSRSFARMAAFRRRFSSEPGPGLWRTSTFRPTRIFYTWPTVRIRRSGSLIAANCAYWDRSASEVPPPDSLRPLFTI
jgi:hypothetical protein